MHSLVGVMNSAASVHANDTANSAAPEGKTDGVLRVERYEYCGHANWWVSLKMPDLPECVPRGYSNFHMNMGEDPHISSGLYLCIPEDMRGPAEFMIKEETKKRLEAMDEDSSDEEEEEDGISAELLQATCEDSDDSADAIETQRIKRKMREEDMRDEQQGLELSASSKRRRRLALRLESFMAPGLHKFVLSNREQVYVQIFEVYTSKTPYSLMIAWARNYDTFKSLVDIAWMTEAEETLRKERKGRSEGMPMVFAPKPHPLSGDWKSVGPLQLRSPQTLILPKGTLEDLIQDVEWFFKPETRTRYAEQGRHYQRGYLLEGKPGTGKSTTAMVIASKFKLDVFRMSMSNLTSDDFLSLMSRPRKLRLILLEDIDVVMDPSRRRKEGGVGFDVFLSALDSIPNKDGLLLFMTTNYKQELPKASIRAGRIDKRVHYDDCTIEQAERLIASCCPDSIPADLQEAILSKVRSGKVTANMLENILINARLPTVIEAMNQISEFTADDDRAHADSMY